MICRSAIGKSAITLQISLQSNGLSTNKKGRGETAPTFLIIAFTRASTSVVKKLGNVASRAPIHSALISDADGPCVPDDSVRIKGIEQKRKTFAVLLRSQPVPNSLIGSLMPTNLRFELLAKLGYAARGIVFILVAALALFSGVAGGNADT